MTIGICNDHAGVDYKNSLVQYLRNKGYEVVNFGTDTPDSIDYPEVAHPLADALLAGKIDLGIAMCGTGNGMALCLNHHKGIRAGIAWNPEVGRLVKAHNKANVLVMPARFISYPEVEAIVDQWLTAPFEGGRHQRRIDAIEP
ncbi:MAG: RpiB/LacA/LacB family sugar-phosphate isomerase [Bacteroidales bacterium]|nr:RpiB/LacA/LacB family sugar-phosphate isomerase [Bacteroidales bacterium]MCR4565587.1 RpiB/LacA/LacB family sugar-phosphate isomerase [Bacteroidales bacterium]